MASLSTLFVCIAQTVELDTVSLEMRMKVGGEIRFNGRSCFKNGVQLLLQMASFLHLHILLSSLSLSADGCRINAEVDIPPWQGLIQLEGCG